MTHHNVLLKATDDVHITPVPVDDAVDAFLFPPCISLGAIAGAKTVANLLASRALHDAVASLRKPSPATFMSLSRRTTISAASFYKTLSEAIAGGSETDICALSREVLVAGDTIALYCAVRFRRRGLDPCSGRVETREGIVKIIKILVTLSDDPHDEAHHNSCTAEESSRESELSVLMRNLLRNMQIFLQRLRSKGRKVGTRTRPTHVLGRRSATLDISCSPIVAVRDGTASADEPCSRVDVKRHSPSRHRCRHRSSHKISSFMRARFPVSPEDE
jgi:hypothetical protein